MFTAPAGTGSGSNTLEILFSITSVTTATHAALFDAAAAGNMMMYTPLTSSLGPTVSGDTIRFIVGSTVATFQ